MRRRSKRLLRHSVLGEESLYRVVSERGGIVELEVVRAPSLEPGDRYRLTAEAVREMAVIDEDAELSAGVDDAEHAGRREPFPRWAALKARRRT